LMRILVKRVGSPMTICTFTGVDADATTILQVKLLVQKDIFSQSGDKDTFPPDTQRIIFQGKQMEEAASLTQCGMHGDEAVIHVVFRLHGASRKEEVSGDDEKKGADRVKSETTEAERTVGEDPAAKKQKKEKKCSVM
jgi:hypothetical protein